MNKKDNVNPVEDFNNQLKLIMEFWQNCAYISKYQKDIANNYQDIFFGVGTYKRFMQLAPDILHQTINPMAFSLMNFTNEIKGDSALEAKILKEVAGYGSQLGTIIDFLELLEKEHPIDKEKLKETKEILQVHRFKELAEKIENIKEK